MHISNIKSFNNSMNQYNFDSVVKLSNDKRDEFLLANALIKNEPFDVPISIEQGILRSQEIYSDSFLDKIELNIADEVKNYNLAQGYNIASFATWLAIQNYKKSGYIRANSMLPTTPDESHDHLVEEKRLINALKHLSVIEARDNECIYEILYYGEIRKQTTLDIFYDNKFFISKFFMSTFEDKNIAESFLSDKLTAEHINVMYKIIRTTSFAGANISNLLNDEKDEVTFPPETKFIIINIENKKNIMNIHMMTDDINKEIWTSELFL